MSEKHAMPVGTAGPIGPETTINDAILIRPEAVSVFRRFGLDACCGGGLPIAEAARRHGHDPAAVLAALDDQVVQAG